MLPWGVGLVCWPDLLEFARTHDAIDVIEIEPQTFWHPATENGKPTLRVDDAVYEALAALPQPKLLHSVGLPFANACGHDAEQLRLLADAARHFKPAWVSDHLSFNRVHDADRIEEAGFLLPPEQSNATIGLAAARILELQAALNRPIAFETGVNYFPFDDTGLTDGAFFAGVAQATGAGILLDLHNLYCNEWNRGQSVSATLSVLPLEQVWEIHVAGGLLMDDIWLDSHTGPCPQAVEDLLAAWLPRLPNVRALIYEALPGNTQRMGLDAIDAQLHRLARIWHAAKPHRICAEPLPLKADGSAPPAETAPLVLQQAALARRIGNTSNQSATTALYRKLITNQRASAITREMRHTMVLLLLYRSTADIEQLLDSYCASGWPQASAPEEALAFAAFLDAGRDTTALADIPYLDDVLRLEAAHIRTRLSGVPMELHLAHDVQPVLAALARPERPPVLPSMPMVVTLSPV